MIKKFGLILALFLGLAGVGRATLDHSWALASDTTDGIGGASYNLVNVGGVTFQTVGGYACAGLYSSSKYLSGTASLLTYLNTLDLTAATVSMDLYVNSNTSGASDVPLRFGNAADTVGVRFTALGSNPGPFYGFGYSEYDGGGGVSATWTHDLPVGSWHNYLVKFTLNRLDLFFDNWNTSAGTTGSTATMASLTQFIVGANKGGTNPSDIIYIKNLKIYSDAQSPGTLTPTPTPSKTTSPTPTTTATHTPTWTPTATYTPTWTKTTTSTITYSPTNTYSPTRTTTATQTVSSTRTPTVSPTMTPTILPPPLTTYCPSPTVFIPQNQGLWIDCVIPAARIRLTLTGTPVVTYVPLLTPSGNDMAHRMQRWLPATQQIKDRLTPVATWIPTPTTGASIFSKIYYLDRTLGQVEGLLP